MWNLIFPILLILGFAFAFSHSDYPAYTIGVHPASVLENPENYPVLNIKHIRFVPVEHVKSAVEKVRYHQLDMVISLQDPSDYWVNEHSPKGYLVEKIVAGAIQQKLVRKEVTGKPMRYIDWLIPGILVMNMMFSALFGVGWVIVRYRKTGYLKRLKATPLKPIEFLIAQCLSRLAMLFSSSTLVFISTYTVVRFTLNGSLLLLALVFMLGCFCMISLGLVFASRFTNEELVSGLIYLITLPMMFLSEVWFSLEGLHPFLQKAALILPLPHIVHAIRAIMLDGASLTDIIGPVTVIGAMGFMFLFLGALLFRWE